MIRQKVFGIAHGFENGIALVSILLLGLLPFSEVIARKIFHTGIQNSMLYVQHLVLITTFLAGAITSLQKKHLSLSLTLPMKPSALALIQMFVAVLGASLTLAFAWSSFSFALNGFDAAQKVGPFSLRLVTLIMVLGYLLMGIRFISTQPNKRHKCLLYLTAFLCASVIAFESVMQILRFFFSSLPQTLVSLQSSLQVFLSHAAIPLIFLLIASAIFGAPIFVILGGIGYLLFARQGQPLEVIPNQAYAMLTGHAVAAIPLFTVTGFLLSESKAGERLVKLFQAVFSWFPGGLAVMAILVCAFFTTFTGASGVTIVALGGLLSYILINRGYKKRFSVGLLTASGSIGLLFPPSLPVIIYGVIAQVSIKDMFIGGILPGIVLVLAMTAVGITYGLVNNVERHSFELKEAWRSFKESIWEILLPLVIIAGYFGGITTLVESSAIALVYALVVEVFIKRDLKPRDLSAVFSKCFPIIGGVLTILALANGLSYYIIDAEIPMKLSAWVQASIHSKYIFLLILNLALLVVGCFLDIYSAILVVVPLIIPLGNIFGIHPVHLGIIFLANMELGYLTPPVGLNLYLASYRFEESVGKVYKDVFVFLMIQLVTVLIITYVPFLSTALLK